MELHHDPFLSFALSGYNHEWYGTVHAHHASLSFPICMENIFGWHSIHHPFPTRRRRYHYMRNIFTFASMLSRIIHGCIQETLPYRISVYRKQAGNSETMTSTRKTRNGNHQVWYMEAIQASLSHANSQLQRRIEQDEHDPVQFCSSTYVDIADNNRKSQARCQQNASIANIKASVNAMRQAQTIWWPIQNALTWCAIRLSCFKNEKRLWT